MWKVAEPSSLIQSYCEVCQGLTGRTLRIRASVLSTVLLLGAERLSLCALVRAVGDRADVAYARVGDIEEA